jgi:hypothetical protein
VVHVFVKIARGRIHVKSTTTTAASNWRG